MGKDIKVKKIPAIPSPSSSLIILSPLQERCQGFDYRLVMVRRNAKSSFKNATVFPGGNLDLCDHDNNAGPLDKPSLDAFRRCALREAFEETGILITDPRVTFARGDRKIWRDKVHNDSKLFKAMLENYHVSINTENLHHYANWITPEPLARRYDTQFFIAVVDSAETLPARHDRSETLEIGHFTPQEAIDAHKKGEIVLFLPQLYMLHDMALCKSYSELLRIVNIRPVVTTQPMMQAKLGFVALPGDEHRGGRSGTKNRVNVSFQEGNLVPSRVVRQNLEGFEDIVADEVPASVETAFLKSNL